MDKRYQKWLVILYGSLSALGIIILVLLSACNVLSWGVLYAWLVAIPFGITSIVGFTYIPEILVRYAKKPKTNKKNLLMVLGAVIYVGRYLLYVTPILIVAGVNGFQIEGIFNPFGAVACIVLVPLCGVILNFVLLKIDVKKSQKKGENNVPTGDSLLPN